MAIIPKSEIWRPTFNRFCTVRKLELVTVRSAQMINRASRMPISRAAKNPFSRRFKPTGVEINLLVACSMKIRAKSPSDRQLAS